MKLIITDKMTKKDKLKLLIIRLKENKEEDKKKAFEFIKYIRDGRQYNKSAIGRINIRSKSND